MKSLFYGRVPLEAASALIQFQKKGITQELLHNLKYRGQQRIGTFFGKWLGEELKDINPYTTVDMVIPVPLHKRRLRERGYNQVSTFGKEIANALQVPFKEDVLLRVSQTGSQVFKERLTRFGSDHIFTIQKNEEIQNKHILIVDDIVTTGATLENCAKVILEKSNAKISFVTIAIA
ncbi:ComF family protein [Jejudonia soesokkakensis]|uniref:ComF family protein n=1 Tax=Jejudonia soesokkakensis TaxID=1323432 RepID=A0ABW2MPR8_9FLAO